MRAGRWIVVLILGGAAAAMYLGCVLRRAAAPPSVVLVTIDTLRADRLGAYGRAPSITPELDALAARGVVFEHAWTTAPITVAAHATLLTGLIPPKHGLRVNRPPAPLPPLADRRFLTLAEAMKEQGYATAAFVSASVLRASDTGLAAGFDVYDDELPPMAPGSLHDAERRGRGEETVDRALAWAKDASGPVLLWVHLFDPHAPYDAPAPWGAGPEHVADAQGYDGEVAYADHCVGRLLKGFAASGHGEPVVVVVADHGEGLGEHGEASHGYLLHEATLHVPLIFAAPGLAPAHRAEPVSSVDVFPTLLSLAGLPVPPQVNGVPLFEKGRSVAASRPLYAESLYAWHACRWAQSFALRRGDEKLVASGPRTMAFDLAKDPGEEHPSAPDRAQAEALAQAVGVAREPALGRFTPGAPAEGTVAYIGGGTSEGTPVLSDADDAKLPSPYDRMDDLAKFDAACGRWAAGDFAGALAAFDDLLAKDPGNLQVAFWRGRPLEGLHRDADAAAAYRHAFEIGLRSPQAVSKALQCSLKALHPEGSDPAEWNRAVSFLAGARAKRFDDDAATLLFEAFLYLQAGHVDAAKAAEALRRAESAPGAEAVRAGIDQAQALLAAARK
jgi:arylsulfatase A-like enzyme